MDAVVALKVVEVDYPGRGRVLGPFDLALTPGEHVALVGPSGCGKSTALRLLAGLEPPSRGEVIHGAGRGRTAVVFQSPTLPPWLDAAAAVALPLELAGVPRREARARAAESLERVGLADAATCYPHTLSGGMAMRVSLARALVTRPRLLLLDEPFAALDEIVRRRLADDVLTLAGELGCAMAFVTHSVEEAVYMAGRVVVMTPGPGRRAFETVVAGPLPRPAGFRAEPAFRETVETVSSRLAQTMEPA